LFELRKRFIRVFFENFLEMFFNVKKPPIPLGSGGV